MPNTRWRRASTATAALCVIVGVLTGCDAPAQDQMTTLLVEHELPYLGSTAAIRGVADWRRLGYPTTATRADFTSDEMTYRVISASPNQAELAVWLTGQPGGEPFNSQADVTATAHGCVLIRRASAEATVTSTVRNCPADLVTTPPPADNASWARDSEAVAAAQRLVDSTTTPRLVRTSAVEVGGRRREPPTPDHRRTPVLPDRLRAVGRDGRDHAAASGRLPLSGTATRVRSSAEAYRCLVALPVFKTGGAE